MDDDCEIVGEVHATMTTPPLKKLKQSRLSFAPLSTKSPEENSSPSSEKKRKLSGSPLIDKSPKTPRSETEQISCTPSSLDKKKSKSGVSDVRQPLKEKASVTSNESIKAKTQMPKENVISESSVKKGLGKAKKREASEETDKPKKRGRPFKNTEADKPKKRGRPVGKNKEADQQNAKKKKGQQTPKNNSKQIKASTKCHIASDEEVSSSVDDGKVSSAKNESIEKTRKLLSLFMKEPTQQAEVSTSTTDLSDKEQEEGASAEKENVLHKDKDGKKSNDGSVANASENENEIESSTEEEAREKDTMTKSKSNNLTCVKEKEIKGGESNEVKEGSAEEKNESRETKGSRKEASVEERSEAVNKEENREKADSEPKDRFVVDGYKAGKEEVVIEKEDCVGNGSRVNEVDSKNTESPKRDGSLKGKGINCNNENGKEMTTGKVDNNKLKKEKETEEKCSDKTEKETISLKTKQIKKAEKNCSSETKGKTISPKVSKKSIEKEEICNSQTDEKVENSKREEKCSSETEEEVENTKKEEKFSSETEEEVENTKKEETCSNETEEKAEDTKKEEKCSSETEDKVENAKKEGRCSSKRQEKTENTKKEEKCSSETEKNSTFSNTLDNKTEEEKLTLKVEEEKQTEEKCINSENEGETKDVGDDKEDTGDAMDTGDTNKEDPEEEMDTSLSNEHGNASISDTPKSSVCSPEGKAVTPGSTPSRTLVNKKPRTLTPKQKAKEAEKQMKREERERQKQEREKKKQEELAEKEKLRKQKEEERLKQKEEKEKIKEDQRKKRQEEIDAKRQKKEEIQQKKDEEKKLKEEKKLAEEEEKRKAEEEKQKNAEKRKQRFTSFFVAKKRDQSANTMDDDDSPFQQFQIKEDMQLAPLVRREFTEAEHLELSEYLSGERPPSSKTYLKAIKYTEYVKGKCERTFPPRDKKEVDDDIEIIEGEEDDEDNIDLDGLVCDPEVGKANAKCTRAKLLSFCENRRPAYWGTWSKKSVVVSARKPFAKDSIFDYEYDSDDDWEEEEAGESLSDSEGDDKEEKEEEGDQYEVDNDFFVPHGYLSDDEGQSDQEDDKEQDPPPGENNRHSEQLKQKQAEFEEEMKKKTKTLKPRVMGCLWIGDENNNAAYSQLLKILSPHKAVTLCSQVPIGTTYGGVMAKDIKDMKQEEEGANEDKTSIKRFVKTFPEEAVPALIRLLHGNRNGKTFLAREFCDYWRKLQLGELETEDEMEVPKTPSDGYRFISKKKVEAKIQELGKWKKCPDKGPMFKTMMWFVPEEIRKSFELSDLSNHNSWSYINKPKDRNLDSPEVATEDGSINTKGGKLMTITAFTKKLPPTPCTSKETSPNSTSPASAQNVSSALTPSPSPSSDTPLSASSATSTKTPLSASSAASTKTPLRKLGTPGEMKKKVNLFSVPRGQDFTNAQKSSFVSFFKKSKESESNSKLGAEKAKKGDLSGTNAVDNDDDDGCIVLD